MRARSWIACRQRPALPLPAAPLQRPLRRPLRRPLPPPRGRNNHNEGPVHSAEVPPAEEYPHGRAPQRFVCCKPMTRFIFITGGVVSSLGKGLSSAALGALLQTRGYRVRLRKLDPYLNVDPGTMSPYQHGEVFVTDDGAETDLDLGHYERFTGADARQGDNITTGRIYSSVIARERRGE